MAGKYNMYIQFPWLWELYWKYPFCKVRDKVAGWLDMCEDTGRRQQHEQLPHACRSVSALLPSLFVDSTVAPEVGGREKCLQCVLGWVPFPSLPCYFTWARCVPRAPWHKPDSVHVRVSKCMRGKESDLFSEQVRGERNVCGVCVVYEKQGRTRWPPAWMNLGLFVIQVTRWGWQIHPKGHFHHHHYLQRYLRL